MQIYRIAQPLKTLDQEYFQAIESNNTQKAQKMLDEEASKNGFNQKLYHGTPTGGFTVFEERPTYFSASKEIADIYKSPSASSIRTWAIPSDMTPETKEVYIKTGEVFDTRNPQHKELFDDEFFMGGGEEWTGSSTPLSQKGIPEWTDGRDLHDWISETGKPFKGMILDEGGLPTEDGDVKDRGESVVVWEPSSIKSAEVITYNDEGEIIPLSKRFDSGKDIRGDINAKFDTYSQEKSNEAEEAEKAEEDFVG